MAIARKPARLARAGVGMSILVGAVWAVGCSSTNSSGRQSCGADGVCNSDCPTTGQFTDPDCTGGGGSSSGGSSSGGSSSGGSSSGGSCSVTDPGDPCEVCTMGACCDEFNACQASSDCLAAVTCINGCSTDTCITDCITAHPTGTSILLDMYDCMDSYCASECGT